jgi:chaperonin GroES
MSLPFHPCGDRLIVRRFQPKSRTAGGIIIAEQAKELPRVGRIEAVGDDVSGKTERAPEQDGLGYTNFHNRFVPDFQVGEVVIFSRYAGVELPEADKNLLLMPSSDIIAKVTDPEFISKWEDEVDQEKLEAEAKERLAALREQRVNESHEG